MVYSSVSSTPPLLIFKVVDYEQSRISERLWTSVYGIRKYIVQRTALMDNSISGDVPMGI